jgi:preprotein translocase subunit SecA
MRLFASPRMTALLQRFRPPEGEPISAKVLNKSIETAQKRVEQRNYTMRKHTLEYDDVMNKQRQEVYAFRNDLLFAEHPIQIAEELLETVARQVPTQELSLQFPVTFEEASSEKENIEKILSAFQQKLMFQRQLLSSFRPELNEAEKSQNVLQEVIRNLMIREIDQLWQGHLLAIDHLRSDVHMRTVGQKDPLLEFKHESFALFEAFSTRLRQQISRDLFRFEMMPQQPAPPTRSKRIPTLLQGA